MPRWTVVFSSAARKDLEDLDKPVQLRISKYVRRLESLDDPRSLGEALAGTELGSYWKYRVGDYRIVATLRDAFVEIWVVRIGHRREVYR